MEVMENVPDGEVYEAWRRLHHACDPQLPGRCLGILLDIMNHVLPEVISCKMLRRVREEEQNLKVAAVHKNLQDAGKHLLRSAVTLNSFTSIKDEVINYSLAKAAVLGTAPLDVDQGEDTQSLFQKDTKLVPF